MNRELRAIVCAVIATVLAFFIHWVNTSFLGVPLITNPNGQYVVGLFIGGLTSTLIYAWFFSEHRQ